jgi:hypothetical protein
MIFPSINAQLVSSCKNFYIAVEVDGIDQPNLFTDVVQSDFHVEFPLPAALKETNQCCEVCNVV